MSASGALILAIILFIIGIILIVAGAIRFENTLQPITPVVTANGTVVNTTNNTTTTTNWAGWGLIILGIFFIIIALAVGIGYGRGHGHGHHDTTVVHTDTHPHNGAVGYYPPPSPYSTVAGGYQTYPGAVVGYGNPYAVYG